MEKKGRLLQKTVKKATSSKEEAIKFLKSANIMAYKWNLSPKYRYKEWIKPLFFVIENTKYFKTLLYLIC